MGSRGRLLSAMTVRESAASLARGDVTSRLLLQSAVTRMGPTRTLNAFIGGVLPRAVLDADASDARRLSPSDDDNLQRQSGSGSVGGGDVGSGGGGVAGSGGGGGGGNGSGDGNRVGGGVLSALDGIPIAVKDNFCVKGAPTTAGSKMLRGFSPEMMESTVTARLSAAGGGRARPLPTHTQTHAHTRKKNLRSSVSTCHSTLSSPFEQKRSRL